MIWVILNIFHISLIRFRRVINIRGKQVVLSKKFDTIIIIIFILKVQYPMYIKIRVQWTYNDIHNNHSRNINIIQII